jgi:hypothetical protein
MSEEAHFTFTHAVKKLGRFKKPPALDDLIINYSRTISPHEVLGAIFEDFSTKEMIVANFLKYSGSNEAFAAVLKPLHEMSRTNGYPKHYENYAAFLGNEHAYQRVMHLKADFRIRFVQTVKEFSEITHVESWNAILQNSLSDLDKSSCMLEIYKQVAIWKMGTSIINRVGEISSLYQGQGFLYFKETVLDILKQDERLPDGIARKRKEAALQTRISILGTKKVYQTIAEMPGTDEQPHRKKDFMSVVFNIQEKYHDDRLTDTFILQFNSLRKKGKGNATCTFLDIAKAITEQVYGREPLNVFLNRILTEPHSGAITYMNSLSPNVGKSKNHGEMLRYVLNR